MEFCLCRLIRYSLKADALLIAERPSKGSEKEFRNRAQRAV
jgi:hypothetical protein